MAAITLTLIYNRQTGKKDLWIDLASDPDALPVEHERHHRQLVEALLGKGVLRADELGEVQVRRGGASRSEGAAAPAPPAPPVPWRREGEGS